MPLDPPPPDTGPQTVTADDLIADGRWDALVIYATEIGFPTGAGTFTCWTAPATNTTEVPHDAH